jgi:hypothetical protein
LQQHPFNTAANAINETASRINNVSRIAGSELDNYYAAIKPFHTNFHKEQRLGFALHFLQKEDFWNRVVFSDEKTFKSKDPTQILIQGVSKLLPKLHRT